MGALARVCDPAADLARMIGREPKIREHRHGIVAGLLRQAGEIDAAAVDARRRSGFQAVHAQRQFAQARGQACGWRIPGAAARIILEADMDLAGEEGARGQHDAARGKGQAHLRHRAGHAVAFDSQIFDRLLEDGKIRLGFQHAPDRGLVQGAVGLAARRAHGRTLGCVQRAPLDAGAIGRHGHRAAEGVDFLDQMTLADAADGRIAAHLAEGFDIVGQQQGARTQTRGGERGLGAGMAAADDDHIVVVCAVGHDADSAASRPLKLRGANSLRSKVLRVVGSIAAQSKPGATGPAVYTDLKEAGARRS